MKLPKSYKYKKMSKPLNGRALYEVKSTSVSKGFYGLKVIENGRISKKELESLKKLLLKRIKKTGKIHVNVFLDHFSTSKPLEVRMGKGKGSLNEWMCLVRKGTVIFELSLYSSSKVDIVKVLQEGCTRIGLKTKVVKYLV